MESSGRRKTNLRCVLAFLVFIVLVCVVLFSQAKVLVNYVPDNHLSALLLTKLPLNTTTHPPLISTVAPLFFPIGRDGKIVLPPNFRNVVIDVGARNSDYLRRMEALEDNSTVLVLVDPLPDSYVPLTQRTSSYAMRKDAGDKGKSRWLDPMKQSQVFALRAALGKEEGNVNFNIGTGPACGSILETSNSSDVFWCFKSRKSIQTIVLTLYDLVGLFPDSIETFNLKVDVEGADLGVLQGAKERIRKFDTVIIECSPPGKNSSFEGGCLYEDARRYMEDEEFLVEDDNTVEGYNMFFTIKNREVKLPLLLTNGGLVFSHVFYSKFTKYW